jgi:4-hydroxy-3-methylbut-2-en-1-yl diphosphate reductase
VIEQMDAAGAVRVSQVEELHTRKVLLTAHGAPERLKLQLRDQGFEVHDATCPLVKRVHLAVQRFLDEQRHPVVIGQPEHVEVRGLVGDLDDFTIIEDEADLQRLAPRLREDPRARLGVVAQTTQPLERVEQLVAALQCRYPQADVRFIDTVCQPTKDRQLALRQLALETDVLIVVGGIQSNNSRKLTELARSLDRRAYQVSGASDLRPEWFQGCRLVGLTAGTSTPDRVIHEVREWLEAH